MSSIDKKITTTYSLIFDAIHDYYSSRGSEHLRLLLNARKQLRKARKDLQKKKTKVTDHLNLIKVSYDRSVLLALEKYIAENAYLEIPTVFQAQWNDIYASLFRGQLDDLKNIAVSAYISVDQQKDIRNLVSTYKPKLKQLITMDFPGKQEIAFHYIENKKPLLVQMDDLNMQIFLIDRCVDRCDLAIFQLKKVNVFDFILLAMGRESNNKKVTNYMTGLFGEWESVPYWFKEIINFAEESNAFQAS